LAYEMGILDARREAAGVAVWDERTFDSADLALFTSYTHPDADQAELHLLTDWYVWGFFFDHEFVAAFKRRRDVPGATRYLGRLCALLTLTPEPRPDSATPVEQALHDVWSRTAFTTSIAWRQRCAAHLREFLEDPLGELTTLVRNDVSNPIDYVHKRRRAGGVPWIEVLVSAMACS
jgi:germacradienol/geosmin synthase